MDELEALVPHAKDLYNTLGKPVADRLAKVLKHYGHDLAKYPLRMIERKDAEADANTKARVNEIERKDAEADANTKARINEIERKDTEDDAISEVRIKLLQGLTQDISDNPNLDSVLVKQVLSQGLSWALEDVVNFNNIISDTVSDMLNNPLPEDNVNANQTTEDVSKDWLNEFRSVACKKNTAEAHALFRKVLAGEIRKPGSFSLLTVSTLASMNNDIIQLFNTFCSLCLVHLSDPNAYLAGAPFKIEDARLPILRGSMKDAETKKNTDLPMKEFTEYSQSLFDRYNLNTNSFELLLDHRLIVDDTVTKYNHIWYNNELWTFKLPNDQSVLLISDIKTIPISGLALTSVGKELYNLTEQHADPEYWKNIFPFIQNYYDVELYKPS